MTLACYGALEIVGVIIIIIILVSCLMEPTFAVRASDDNFNVMLAAFLQQNSCSPQTSTD